MKDKILLAKIFLAMYTPLYHPKKAKRYKQFLGLLLISLNIYLSITPIQTFAEAPPGTTSSDASTTNTSTTTSVTYPNNITFKQDKHGNITIPEYKIENNSDMDYTFYGLSIVGNEGWKTADETYKFEFVDDLTAIFKVKVGDGEWQPIIDNIDAEVSIPAHTSLDIKWDIRLGASSKNISYNNAFTVIPAIGSDMDKCFEIGTNSTISSGYGIKNYKCYPGNKEGLPEISDVEIPETVKGKTIVFADTNSFNNRKLTSVKMNDSMRVLAAKSFNNNLIKYVYLNNVTELGAGVNGSTFDNNLIETIDLSKVEVFGVRDFRNNHIHEIIWNKSIESINLPNNLFEGNKELLKVEIPNNIRKIGDYTFSECGLQSITFEEGSILNIIGQSAFKGISPSTNHVQNLILPPSVETIQAEAFYGLGIENLTLNIGLKKLASGNSLYKGVFENNYIKSIDFTQSPLLEYLGDRSFKYNSIESAHIPNIEYLGSSLLSYNSIKTLTMDEGITKIPDYFVEYNKIESFNSPQSVTEIGDGSFFNNPMVEFIYSNNLIKIGKETFKNTLLTEAILPPSLKSIGVSAYENCHINKLELSASLESIGKLGFANNLIENIDLTKAPLLTVLEEKVFFHNKLTNLLVTANITKMVYNSLGENNLEHVEIQGKAELTQWYIYGVFASNSNLLKANTIKVPLDLLEYYRSISYKNWFNTDASDAIVQSAVYAE